MYGKPMILFYFCRVTYSFQDKKIFIEFDICFCGKCALSIDL